MVNVFLSGAALVILHLHLCAQILPNWGNRRSYLRALRIENKRMASVDSIWLKGFLGEVLWFKIVLLVCLWLQCEGMFQLFS